MHHCTGRWLGATSDSLSPHPLTKNSHVPFEGGGEAFITVRNAHWPEAQMARVKQADEFTRVRGSYMPEVTLVRSGQKAANWVNL